MLDFGVSKADSCVWISVFLKARITKWSVPGAVSLKSRNWSGVLVFHRGSHSRSLLSPSRIQAGRFGVYIPSSFVQIRNFDTDMFSFPLDIA